MVFFDHEPIIFQGRLQATLAPAMRIVFTEPLYATREIYLAAGKERLTPHVCPSLMSSSHTFPVFWVSYAGHI